MVGALKRCFQHSSRCSGSSRSWSAEDTAEQSIHGSGIKSHAIPSIADLKIGDRPGFSAFSRRARGWSKNDPAMEPGEGQRFVVRIRQRRGMNGPARSYYPTTTSCFNGVACRRFRINGLMGVGPLPKENTPNENPKLVPWEMSAIARNPPGAGGHRLSLTGPTHHPGEPSRCEAVTY